MRIVLTIWMLLYFLVAALAATSRSLQSSTPRYNDDRRIGSQSNIFNSLVDLDNSPTSRYESDRKNDDTGLEIALEHDGVLENSRKLRNRHQLPHSSRNSSENYFKLHVKRKYITIINNTTKNVKTTTSSIKYVESTTPKSHKTRSSTKQTIHATQKTTIKPIKNTIRKPVIISLEKRKNQSIPKKKIVSSLKPLKTSTEKLKFQNSHYRNYTKFRIKPSNKQAGINPVIDTYSPEFPINNTPLDAPEIQDNSGINPVISSYSPQYSLSNPVEEVSEIQNPQILNSLSPTSNPFGVPISQVVLQSIPTNTDTKDGVASDCPSFQVSSYLYGPQRQGCSDISVVINSQLSQNMITERPNSNSPARPADLGEPVADEPVAVAADEPVAVDPPAAAGPPAAAPPAAVADAPASGGSQGGGGLPVGLPTLPQLPQLGFPDLKGLFDLLGGLWMIISRVFGFLANPYLYLVPIALSFGLGFLVVLKKFFWFVLVPSLFLYGYLNKDEGKPKIVYHKYPTETVHHEDGWFYNENSKTYENIAEYMHHKNVPLNVPRMINNFKKKFAD